MIKVIALTTVETGSLLSLSKEKLGRSIAIDVDAAKKDIKSIPSVISCLKHFSKRNPDLRDWDSTLGHVFLSAIVTTEEKSELWAFLQSTAFKVLLSENQTIAIFTADLLTWLIFCVQDWKDLISMHLMANELYNQFIFAGFAPFFVEYRQVMKNGYFQLQKVK